MKKAILSIIAVLFLCVATSAQNTGYMGRYVLFNAEVSLSPSWFHPNPLTEALAERFPDSKSARKYLGLNYFVTPNIEAIVWKKGTVGAGYNFYKSPFDGSSPRWVEYQDHQGYYYSEELYEYDFTGTITAHGFNVFYKQYLGNTRAPMGPFLKVVFDGFFYNIDHHDRGGNTVHPDVITAYPDMGVNHGSLFGLKLELGRDYMLFNFLRLSTSLSVGTTFGGFKSIAIVDKYPDHPYGHTPNSYARNRILSAYWFGLKVGVGFLTF